MKLSTFNSQLSTLRIGVIGAGGRGHLSKHAQAPDIGGRIVALCDTDPAAFAGYADVCPPDIFKTADYREILARPDVDAVFITTPDFLHEEMAVAALEAGKAVYLEKPMAITTEGCDRILATAKRTGSRLYLGHNMRHMTFIRKMKELIDNGAIGEVKAAWCRHFIAYGCDAYFKDWHAERSKANSLLLQKAAHDIDVMHWLCGGFTRRVTAQGALTVYNQITDRHSETERGDASWSNNNWPPLSQKSLNPIIDVEDLSHVLMTLDNGVLMTYQQCHFSPDAWRNYTIIGTEGRIENLGEERVAIWRKRCYYKPEGDEIFDCNATDDGHGGADPRIVAEFVRYAREGGETTTTPIAAREAVATGCAAAYSLRHGSVPVDVPVFRL
ncbi:MAG: Gfo/Idh/MocA family oxidoreductase [Kiritimatiellaeota bacterium]|nr:Gfo/Idh/MocA family oxidoreductase [Kiritimatiellota bacterium]